MAYKTITAALDSTVSTKSLCAFSTALARKFSSHIIGLHVETISSVTIAAPMEIPDPIAAQAIHDMAAGETHAIKSAFDEAMSGSGIDHSWYSFITTAGSAAQPVLSVARSSDLVVAMQTSDSALSDSRAEIENYLYESGRPVLLVPNHHDCSTDIKRILIAWNGSREATRAVFDAMPFLKMAEHVELFTFGNDNEAVNSPEKDNGALMVDVLRRHGVNVEFTIQERERGLSAQAAIKQKVTDGSVDLLVMGAYGNSRWWEMLFGGVTRGMLDKLTALTLMSR